MPQFDPRRPTLRRSASFVSPRPALALMALAALATGAGFAARASGLIAPSLARASAPAIASKPARPTPPAAPCRALIEVMRGETLAAAIARAGVTPQEAQAAVAAMQPAFDTAHFKAGLDLEATVAPVGGRLLALTLPTGPVSSLSLARGADGAFAVTEHTQAVHDDTAVAQGEVRGSLYESALHAGADSRLTAEVVKLFAKKLDFARDFHPGDAFRLVFDRRVSETGKTISTGDLLFAEIGAKGKTTRFYRFESGDKAQYFDEMGKNTQGFLLKTPIDGARVTSGFGLRFHPILAYTRMHQGIDFGASKGTPVYAAGDGTVAEIKRSAGYGNWLEIRHAGGWATGYGHLSAYVRGLRPGQPVAQGQLVAYVGSTGMSTGPHLHYELMQNGRKLDPRSARAPQGTELAGRQLAAFRAAKDRIDDLLDKAAAPDAIQTAALTLRPRAAVSPMRTR